MKVALILCPFWDTKYPPLSAGLLSAVLKNSGHEVVNYDLNRLFFLKHRSGADSSIWKTNFELYDIETVKRFIMQNNALLDSYIENISRSAVIGFTIYKGNETISLELAKRIKKKYPAKIVIFGGPGCFKHEDPESFIRKTYVDFVVIGEGEKTLPELILKISKTRSIQSCKGVLYKNNSQMQYSGDREPVNDMDSLPVSDFSGLIDLYKGRPVILPLQSSRGCVNRCSFCNEGMFWRKFKSMSGERIFQEIKQLVKEYGADQFVFHDSLVNGDMKALIRFCDLMIANKLELIMLKNKTHGKNGRLSDILWTGQALVRKEMTPDILKKMKLAGCYRLSYGIETGSGKVLKEMNKNFTAEQAKNVLKYTHDAGIIVQMNLMFGFPTEQKEDFEKTINFFKQVRPYVDMIAPSLSFIINKGTLLHKYPDKFGIADQDNALYWESDNGSNNYLERFNRYRKFCGLAARSGIPEAVGLYKEHPHKQLFLSKYYENARLKDKAKKYNNKTNNLEGSLKI